MWSYHTNWMGVARRAFYEENNIPYTLIKKESIFAKNGKFIEYKDYHMTYSCGRIDCYCNDTSDPDYDPYNVEYGLDVMTSYSWSRLSDWLDNFKSERLVPFDELIAKFEKETNHNIQWFQEADSQ